MHIERSVANAMIRINVNSDWSGDADVSVTPNSMGQPMIGKYDARKLLRGELTGHHEYGPSDRMMCAVVSVCVEHYLTHKFVSLAEGLGLPR